MVVLLVVIDILVISLWIGVDMPKIVTTTLESQVSMNTLIRITIGNYRKLDKRKRNEPNAIFYSRCVIIGITCKLSTQVQRNRKYAQWKGTGIYSKAFAAVAYLKGLLGDCYLHCIVGTLK